MPNNFTKFDWSKGINVLDQPNMLPDNEVVRTQNLFPWGPRGLLSSRRNANFSQQIAPFTQDAISSAALPMSQAYRTFAVTSGTTLGSPSVHMVSFIKDTTPSPDPNLPTTYTICLDGRDDSGTLYVPYDTSSGLTHSYGPWRTCDATKMSQMPIAVNYLDKQLWFTNARTLAGQSTGSSESFAVVSYVAGSPGSVAAYRGSLVGTNNGTVRPAGGCVYRQRLVMWNPKDGYEDCLIFTDNNSMVVGDDVLANNRFQRVGSDGVPIVSCMPVMLATSGTPAQVGLLILKRTGAYLLTGEPNQSDETTYFTGNPEMQIIRFNVDATCLSHHTVVQTPYGVIWCGVDDVWVFKEDMVPYRIGTKLNPLIRAAAIGGYGWRANAAFYAGSYRLALPSVAAEIPSATNPYEQYWLELRTGMPDGFQNAAWFGPQIYGDGHNFGVISTDTRYDKTPYLYTPYFMTNDSGGYVINRVQMDWGASGEDVFSATNQQAAYKRTNNFPHAQYTSKDYDMGDSMLDKVYTGTELSIQTEFDIMLRVESNMNTGEDSSVITDIIQPNPVGSYVRSLAYAPDGQRPIGPCITVDIRQYGGFLIVAGVNDNFHFREDGQAWKQTSITPGRYATLAALMDAIVAGMNFRSQHNRTYTHNAAVPRTAMLRITASAGVWDFDPTDTGTYALLQKIGFTQSSYTAALYQTAVTNVGNDPSYPFDVESAILRTFIIPRRPAV